MKYPLAVLLIATVVGGALAYLTREAPPHSVSAELDGVRFVYPHAFARDETTAAGGLTDRLAFLVAFPAFSPPDSRLRSQTLIKVTLTAAEEGLDPQERPSKLYARFLTPETVEGPGGLVLRRGGDAL